jgi:hypothetical protein
MYSCLAVVIMTRAFWLQVHCLITVWTVLKFQLYCFKFCPVPLSYWCIMKPVWRVQECTAELLLYVTVVLFSWATAAVRSQCGEYGNVQLNFCWTIILCSWAAAAVRSQCGEYGNVQLERPRTCCQGKQLNGSKKVNKTLFSFYVRGMLVAWKYFFKVCFEKGYFWSKQIIKVNIWVGF